MKIVLKNSKENTRNREPQGIPKSTQNRPKKAKKWLQGALWKPLGKDVEKATISGPLWTVKMRLAPRRQLDFHFSQALPKSSKNGPKRLPNPTQNAPKSIQERSRKIHKKCYRNRNQKGAKMDPKWEPTSTQNRLWEGSRCRGGAPGVPKAIPGCLLGAILVIFNVFSCFPMCLLRFSCENRCFPMCLSRFDIKFFRSFGKGSFTLFLF